MPCRCRCALLLFVLLAGSSSAFEPESVTFGHKDEIVRGEGFAVLADRRVFAVTAFLNATGYDVEGEGEKMHPVRAEVRRLLDQRLAEHKEQRQRWRTYASEMDLPMFVYLDFSLSLSADYPFRRVRPKSESGYPAIVEKLDTFPEVINEFWQAAKLDEIWGAVKPQYRAELERYDFEDMSAQMARLWRYLRMEH